MEEYKEWKSSLIVFLPDAFVFARSCTSDRLCRVQKRRRIFFEKKKKTKKQKKKGRSTRKNVQKKDILSNAEEVKE